MAVSDRTICSSPTSTTTSRTRRSCRLAKAELSNWACSPGSTELFMVKILLTAGGCRLRFGPTVYNISTLAQIKVRNVLAVHSPNYHGVTKTIHLNLAQVTPCSNAMLSGRCDLTQERLDVLQPCRPRQS